MPKKTHVQKAIAAIDGFAQIVEAEGIVHGTYVVHAGEYDFGDTRPVKQLPVCGAYRACAVGSLVLGAQVVEPRKAARLAFPEGRFSWIEGDAHPGLRLAYNVLNALAASRYANEIEQDRRDAEADDDPYVSASGIDAHLAHVGALEYVFEHGLALPQSMRNALSDRVSKRERKALLQLAADAKAALQATIA